MAKPLYFFASDSTWLSEERQRSRSSFDGARFDASGPSADAALCHQKKRCQGQFPSNDRYLEIVPDAIVRYEGLLKAKRVAAMQPSPIAIKANVTLRRLSLRIVGFG